MDNCLAAKDNGIGALMRAQNWRDFTMQGTCPSETASLCASKPTDQASRRSRSSLRPGASPDSDRLERDGF
ncbi:MAG: hypothetical protein CL583_00565 [Alteromonadaceae bacterium]|nr:hypothetical protein [Alteromonadaceae bacterium]